MYFNDYEKINKELINAWLEIDLKALDNNIRYLKSLLPVSCRMMAVVKAEAYGHGYLEVARQAIANNVSYLGVANVLEAKLLREAGIKEPLLVLGTIFPEQIELAFEYDFETTISSEKNIIDIDRIASEKGRVARVHLKIDSGMGRVGVRPENLDNILKLLKSSKKISLTGVFTHFAESENPDFTFTNQQLKVFKKALEQIRKAGFNSFITHAANSSATLQHPDTFFDMVRPGLAMYGVGDPENENLEQVMSLKSRIVCIKKVPAGNSLGYGRSFFTRRDSLIAIVPIGYADGLPRIMSNKQEVLVRGKRCLISGNISMDQCLVDVTDIPGISEGEEVVLLGKSGEEQISAKEWANNSCRIPYEVLCGFGNRLPKFYLA